MAFLPNNEVELLKMQAALLGATASEISKAQQEVELLKLVVLYTASGGGGGGGSGTVTSVGLSLPSILTVSGSPVTTSGTLAATLATQAANTVFSGPTTGADAAPSFRLLVAADIPKSTVGGNILALTNPSAISFLRVNADNTVDALNAANFRTAIGAGTGNGDASLGTAQTFTAANIFSVNGAASTPAVKLTGSPFTGGSGTTTTPLFGIIPSSGATAVTTWNANGSALGLVLPDANTGAFLSCIRSNTNLGEISFQGRMRGFEVSALGGAGLQCYTAQASAFFETASGRSVLLGNTSTGLRMSSDYYIGWSSSAAGAADAFNNNDVILVRDAAAVLALKNSTKAQSIRVYGTTTASKYLTLSHNATDGVISASSGLLSLDTRVKFNSGNTTGAGSALLGANSPAATLTDPYTWITATSSDGSTVYIPCWK